jgi:hypothetical protein
MMEMGLVRILILFRIGVIPFHISSKTGLERMNRILILIRLCSHHVILLETLAKMQKVAANQRALQHGRMSGLSSYV